MKSADLGSRILWEDRHLLAVNKRPGEISQADRTGDTCLLDDLKAFLVERDAKPGNAFLGLVHRLDRTTSGVMLFSKTSKALERLNESFRGRDVKKTYWAIIQGQPPAESGELVHWISRDTVRNKADATLRPAPDRQEARLDFRLLAAGDRYSLLEINLHTGRHHQIRAQLAAIGLCIKGDLKYGAARSNPDGGICLHAVHLELAHPVGNDRPPVDVWADPRSVQVDSLWSHLVPPDRDIAFFRSKTYYDLKTTDNK